MVPARFHADLAGFEAELSKLQSLVRSEDRPVEDRRAFGRSVIDALKNGRGVRLDQYVEAEAGGYRLTIQFSDEVRQLMADFASGAA